ncbi:MAG: dihydroxy-acid dehydratase [Gammaproteobacteria bacterium]
MSCDDWHDFEDHIVPSTGHCMTMGTASTMTSLAEVLGFSIPGSASIPAVHSAHIRMAAQCGKIAVELGWRDIKPSDILTRDSFENAITTDMAIGGWGCWKGLGT